MRRSEAILIPESVAPEAEAAALPAAPTPSLLRSHLRTLGRATFVSLTAAASEVVLLPILIHGARMIPWVAFLAVQVVATVITFVLNKRWAFDARYAGRTEVQAMRQVIVVAGSWTFNTLLPAWATKHGMQPVPAFILSNIAVYLFWNYPGNRFFVFRETLPR